MGLIEVAKNAAGEILAESWREYFYCDRIEDDVLMVRGQKKTSGKSSNTKSANNIISNGSIIAVNEGQCMLIVDQGGIAEVCAEAGEYIYDSSSEPSIFYGELGENLKKYWQTFYKRVTTGGDIPKDQRIYFVNTREIFDNKFGTQQPIQYRFQLNSDSNVARTLSIRCNGEFSFSITNPVAFYKNVANNVSEEYRKEEIFGFLRSSLLTALQPAFGGLAKQGYHYGDLISAGVELGKEVREQLQEEWQERRGIEIITINVQSMSLPEEQQKWLDEYENAKAYAADADIFGREKAMGLIDAMKAAGGNENGSFNGLYGLAMMGNTMGQMGVNPATMMGSVMGQTGANPTGANQAAMAGGMMLGNAMAQAKSGANGWTCSCGAVNTGKFCTQCGTAMPVVGGWTCSCGAVNKGKFCAECGAKKPVGAPLYRCDKCGWEPENPANPPKFCPECGDKFSDEDIQ